MMRSKISRRPKLSGSTRRFALEQLEQRICMHGEMSVLSEGVLSITGDAMIGDSIKVVMSKDNETIDVIGAHGLRSFDASEVHVLKIESLGGDDLIDLDRDLNMPTLIDGGDGQDTVLGWSAPDRIFSPDDRELIQSFTDSGCIGVECFTITEDDVEPLITNATPSTAEALATLYATGQSVNHAHVATSTVAATSFNSTPLLFGAVSHVTHEILIGVPELAPASVETGTGANAHGADHLTAAGFDTDTGSAAFGMHHTDADSEPSSDNKYNAEWATRSPYQTECPTTAPMGTAAVASSSSPQTVGGQVANTLTGAPKVGCKCLAMQARTNDAAQGENRLGRAAAEQDSAAKTDQTVTAPVDIILDQSSCCTSESDVSESADDSCCSKPEIVDQVLETIDGVETIEESNSQAGAVLGWPEFAVASFLTVGALTVHTKQNKVRRRSDRNALEPEDISFN
jgi:hypothetical protein